jgi:hypothetical protein
VLRPPSPTPFSHAYPSRVRPFHSYPQAAALREMPGGWSVVQDPVTGSTAYWNAVTRRTIITSVG